MDSVCKQTVFDEFGIVQLIEKRHYLRWYEGKRRQDYIRMFKDETALLKKESISRFVNRYDIGDYEFAHDGVGPQAEAFLVIGDNLFLLCTNTHRSMSEVAANPLWLKAQAAFVEISERFRFDPLQIEEPAGKDEILF